jgi:hypothetical protein
MRRCGEWLRNWMWVFRERSKFPGWRKWEVLGREKEERRERMARGSMTVVFVCVRRDMAAVKAGRLAPRYRGAVVFCCGGSAWGGA